jgi:hypothetical protein
MPGALHAEIVVRPSGARRPEELTAVASVVNVGPQPLALNTVPLGSPSLALQIEDDQGRPVLLPPPPVPGELVSKVELGPGERHTTEYAGFVPSWTPPGAYRVRLRYLAGHPHSDPQIWSGEATSPWVEFQIEPEFPGPG